MKSTIALVILAAVAGTLMGSAANAQDGRWGYYDRWERFRDIEPRGVRIERPRAPSNNDRFKDRPNELRPHPYKTQRRRFRTRRRFGGMRSFRRGGFRGIRGFRRGGFRMGGFGRRR